VSGFFRLSGLAVELPVATTIVMRSIADIARSERESRSYAGTGEVVSISDRDPSRRSSGIWH
jgi:hypothetical protein